MAIIVNKDVLAGIAAGSAGASAVLNVSQGTTLSIQSSYTVSAPTGATLTYQVSNDGTVWTNLQTATAITIDASEFVLVPVVGFVYFKVLKAISGGTALVKCQVAVKGVSV